MQTEAHHDEMKHRIQYLSHASPGHGAADSLSGWHSHGRCLPPTEVLSGSASLDCGLCVGRGLSLNGLLPSPWNRDAWSYIRRHHLRPSPKDVPTPAPFSCFLPSTSHHQSQSIRHSYPYTDGEPALPCQGQAPETLVTANPHVTSQQFLCFCL